MQSLIIIPIGNIDPEVLQVISETLQKAFHCKAEIDHEISVPNDAFDFNRKQYHSTVTLKKVKSLKPGKYTRALGVADVDLYIPELNFVFGEADIYTGVAAVISLTRLRQEFYGLNPDKKLFHLRVVKEAIHEIGHTYGLGHCKNPQCIMFFSNTIRDTDKKGPGFCSVCREKLIL
jgi:archaemetzincin